MEIPILDVFFAKNNDRIFGLNNFCALRLEEHLQCLDGAEGKNLRAGKASTGNMIQ